jgi:amino acid adenylation domain-containing protein
MPENMADSFQLSPQQEQLWLSEPEGPTGRIQATLELDGAVDPTTVEATLRQAIGRHESLRTTFVRQPGIRVPVQVIAEALDPAWRTLDLLDAPAAQQAQRVADAAQSELQQPLDFERGPLVRALLFGLGAERQVLVLTLSALCADASSLAVIAAELVQGCGGDAELTEEPLQYADFSAWQRELAESDDEEATEASGFWSEQAEAAAPALPFSSSSTASFVPQEVPVPLDGELAGAIAEQAMRLGASQTAFVQAAWHVLLGRVAGEESVTVALVGSARRHADLRGAVGAFARTVPVQTGVAGTRRFAEVLDEVVQARQDAQRRQDYAPTERSGTLSVGFVDTDSFSGSAGPLHVSLARVLTYDPALRLWLTCTADGGDPRPRIEFDPAVQDGGTVRALARRLAALLRSAASQPDAPVAELELLDGTEREQLLSGFNQTAAPGPERAVHELIAAHAAATPTGIAVADERTALTYAELDARANQLSHRLRECGVGPDDAVGLCTDRSVEMVIGLLGILKAGGAYLPLHHEHPAARLAQQLATANAKAIVTQQPLLSHLPDWAGELVCLDRDEDRAALGAQPATAPAVQVDPDNLAYVIYTSGSTGTPKGVGVTHANLANYAADITHRLGADSEPLAFGLVTSITTDLGNTSVFGALCSGGTLVLVSPAAAADAEALARQLEQTPIDVLKITPSHIGALIAGGEARVLPRRTLVLGGERAPWDLVEKVRGLRDCSILNHYGPTEATVGCCTFPVTNGPGPYEPATVPIGRPIANTACYVLDDRGQPAPAGVPGRLFIGGSGVARGYVGQPELTAEVFVPDPFASAQPDDSGAARSGEAGTAGEARGRRAGSKPEARMYDTGDVVRWLPDGALEFLGRSDEQVKIRGYRVEPAEIEVALRSHPAVGEAVVLAPATASGERRLVAYCTTDGVVREDALRSHLAGLLPEFMVPSAIVTLDTLPRTPSGKVDRLSLPDPQTVADSSTAGYVAPRTPVEQAVAALWSQTLGIEKISVDDDFFELGGHSLLATQVVAQVRSELAVDLPLHSLFTCPTVELLAAEIVQLMGDSEHDDTDELLAQLEGLSDEEAERLLAGEGNVPEAG